MQPGEMVTIQACHADGEAYRRWQSTVEAITAECIVTRSPPGCPIEDVGKGTWLSRWHMRQYLWLERPYNLLEMYHPDETLAQIYINVASPVQVQPTVLSFIDYELDVACVPGQSPQLLDEDEFVAAIVQYGYSVEVQTYCRAVAAEVLVLAQQWIPSGIATVYSGNNGCSQHSI